MMTMCLFNQRYQSGFTLLELVLVLFLIGLLASAGLLFTDNVESQAQYEETQRRIALIRQAVVGDSNKTLNDRPIINGFATDVGRLPLCIEELLTLGEETAIGSGDYRSPCDPSEPEFFLSKWAIDSDTGIGSGWRGPYIQTNHDSDGVKRFRDGYGNGDATDSNFGWNLTLGIGKSEVLLSAPQSAVNANTLRLQSQGPEPDAINTSDNIPDFDPMGDIPALVVADDWQLLQPLKIRFFNVGKNVLSGIDDLEWSVQLTKSDVLESKDFKLSEAASPVQIQPGDFLEVDVDFDKAIPAGQYRLRINCEGHITSDTGLCGTMADDPSATPYSINVLPRYTLGPFRWNIK